MSRDDMWLPWPLRMGADLATDPDVQLRRSAAGRALIERPDGSAAEHEVAAQRLTGQKALYFLGDIDGAKWLVSLGGFRITFLSDSADTTSLGTGDVVYEGRTYRPKVALDPAGAVVQAAGHTATRHLLMQAGAQFLASPSGTRGLSMNGTTLTGSNSPNVAVMMYLDPADWALTGRTPKLRVRGTASSNATATGAGVDIQLALRPITATSGGVGGLTNTIGAAVTGSSFLFNGGADFGAGARSQGESADFDIPAAGYYCLAVNHSANMAANSAMNVYAQLFLRYV